MFRISSYIKKKDSVAAEDFRAYWLGEHAELQKKYLDKIGVRQYVKCESLPDHPGTKALTEAYKTGPLRYDFVDHCVFNDIDELKLGTQNPEVQALMQAVYDSEDSYVDVDYSNVLMSVDVVQYYPADADDVRATENSKYLKTHYPLRIHPHLTREQAQLHWNACHGAFARQYIRGSNLKKYITAPAIDSTFVDQLAATRGYEVDPTFIGHAEAWIDTTQEPATSSPEEEARLWAMSTDDLDLFADTERCSVFFTREHFILDHQVITRRDQSDHDSPMPAFFSAIWT